MKKIALALSLTLVSVHAFAEVHTERFRCYSSGGRFERCPIPTTVSGVAPLHFGADSAKCVLGKTWGYDSLSIWVNEGCRDTFDVVTGGGGVQAVLPPSLNSGAYKDVCPRQEEQLLLPRNQTRWTRLQCEGACNVAFYGIDASNAPGAICGWELGRDQATVTCRNTGDSEKATVYLECAR